MNDYFSSDFKLGVLGGGQLGKMLLSETRKYDIHTCVLDPAADAPGRLACNEFFQGDLKDFDAVYNFGKKVDLLTIEIEAVNIEALEKLEEEGLEIHPSPRILKLIQDKTVQKQFYKDNNIPTSDFEIFNNKADTLLAIANRDWPMPVVWKAATGGYDGFGVNICRNQEDLQNVGDQKGLLEEMVPFEKELAVVVARNKKGETRSFPVVEMEFHPTANQVEFVIAPSSISEDLKEKAQKLAEQVADAFELCGILAVEMFLTKEGEILVNEVAPRTHNSGHLTIESNYTSQFEQHLRAILNLPLGSTDIKTAGVMANLVGTEGFTGNVIYEGYQDLMALDGVNIHIYGKKETRPFRKMGHVTVINKDVKEARKIAGLVKDKISVKA
ncbi:MAG: 5-(carboxyamino)imidazole ribonucleotide synthase [Schleiferiaceae bacterium]|jgi:5-(carboxyamino)imidazole ribonucleotide synthase|nr:5-(carboxyamino)imidazole ribonucleotide synthase [Schleiferiaceae bacterium]